MPLDKIAITIIGIATIAFVYWFFLRKKTKEIEVFESVDITVDGGYSPEVISIPKGKITKLNFMRKDPSVCLEEIVIPEFKIKKYLPLNQRLTVEINPQKAGEFGFACGMNMFHGKIIVKQ